MNDVNFQLPISNSQPSVRLGLEVGVWEFAFFTVLLACKECI
jgi:hypothetical protein